MSLLRIALIDLDEKYLIPIERKFISELGDSAEILVITDLEYLKTFFSSPQKIDLVLMNEKLYDVSLSRHDIGSIYIMTEYPIEDASTGNLDINHIYKYTSVKEIYNVVMNNLKKKLEENNKQFAETKVITVYSPIGGIGKTTVAMGLCKALEKTYKRVLFIGTDNLQSFGYFMNHKVTLKSGMEMQMDSENEYIYNFVKPLIVDEGFGILPPFAKSLSALNINANHYIHLIECIKQSGEYDFIIVDTDTSLSEATTQLMSISNDTMILTAQDSYSAYKLQCLLGNIDCSDKKKFTFICNKYVDARENVLVSDAYINQIRISEYIAFDRSIETLNCEMLGRLDSLQKLALKYI